MGSKYTYENIKNNIENLGYKLITDNYKNNRTKMIVHDLDGYYYLSRYEVIMRNKELSKFHVSNPYTIQNIKLWCKLNNKPFELVSEVYDNKEELLVWQCLKDSCKEQFYCSWHHIIRGKGCGACHGKQVSLSNCLATKNPKLASEWHPTKNNGLTPYDVTSNSGKSIHWQCKKGHEWESVISSRNNSGNDCPYCSGRYPTEENNLLFCNPNLASEWDYNKNDKNPEEYCPNSGKKVNWICKKC